MLEEDSSMFGKWDSKVNKRDGVQVKNLYKYIVQVINLYIVNVYR